MTTMRVAAARSVMQRLLLRPLTAVGLLSLLLCGTIVGADKDDSYYVAGTGNPNVNEPMYWKDAENVLQDLSKFSALYVRYHHW
jgi:hypothetical protein